MPESPFGTIDEVASYLRTTKESLAQDRYHGRGPKYVKHGRRVLYRWSDVYAYVDENTMSRTDERAVSA